MALYSTFKYGDGTKYGAGEQVANLRWTFIIAWDGFYGWGNEANRMVDLSVRRGRSSLISAGGRGFAPFPPGEATVILDNSDGRFDPFNVSSPLYPHVAPGKFIRLAVLDVGDDVNYQIMRGVISDIQPVKRRDVQQVRITIVDGLRWLKDRIIQIGLQQNIEKSSPPFQIIVNAGWPLSEWPFDVDPDKRNQIYWWAWNQNAYEALREWNEAESAIAFHSRFGQFIARTRSYGFLRSTTLNQSEILDDIGRPQPWEVVRNNIRVNVQTKILDEVDATLWEQRDTPAIAAGETFQVEPIFKYQDWQPCGASVHFFFTVNTQADGGGADLSDDCNLVFIADIGEGARCWLTNDSGSDGYIIEFKADGDAIYPPNVDWRKLDDEASRATFGPRTLAINSRWVESSVDAQSMGDWILSELKDPSVQPIVQIEDRPVLQFSPDLWDQIILNAAALGITGELYRVGQITHQTTSESCQGVRTTFRLEPFLQEGDDMSYKGCLVYRATTNQEIDTGSSTAVEFNAEIHDITPGFHSTSVNPERITIPAGMGGFYRIYAQLEWEANATGLRNLYVKLNGGATPIAEIIADATAESMTQFTADAYLLDVGDYVTVEAEQNSGGGLDVVLGVGKSFFGIDFLGTE